MFDTNVTIVGNVLTTPQWRRTANTNSLVANFKVASTARRLDRDTGRWVDGNSLRVRVNCWRRLAEGVASSVIVGDPVVVVGRLYTRDWTDAEGNPRTLYELEAVAVGHDLARGRGRFVRNRPVLATSEVADTEAATRVRGVPTEAVPAVEAPTRLHRSLFDEDPEARPGSPLTGFDPLTVLRDGGLGPEPLIRGRVDGSDEQQVAPAEEVAPGEGPHGEDPGEDLGEGDAGPGDGGLDDGDASLGDGGLDDGDAGHPPVEGPRRGRRRSGAGV